MIEEGLRDSMDAVFGVEACIKDVVDIGVKLKSGDLRVKSVVENLEDEDGYVEEDMHRIGFWSSSTKWRLWIGKMMPWNRN